MREETRLIGGESEGRKRWGIVFYCKIFGGKDPLFMFLDRYLIASFK